MREAAIFFARGGENGISVDNATFAFYDENRRRFDPSISN
jgi:hypothetical protein